MSVETFLITGINGYLGLNIAKQLADYDVKVKGTMRNIKDEKKIKPVLNVSINSKQKIELVEAELLDKVSLAKAVEGCNVVLHVASPLPIEAPTHENEILEPAINGTLNVLEACFNNKSIRRVVVTSSGLAVMGPEYRNDLTYNETHWGDPNTKFTYCKSKILAEKAAWDFVAEKKAKNEKCFELCVINPTFILGPVLHDTLGVSSSRMLNVFANKLEKVPELYFPTCDVRDVALAHIKAASIPEAAGERILIVSSTSFIPMIRWAQILDKEFSSKGYKIPLEEVKGEGKGKTAKIDDSKMRKILGITPIDFEKTVIDMAYSLINKGFLTKP